MLGSSVAFDEAVGDLRGTMKSTHIGRQCLPYLDIGLDRPMSPTILFLDGWGVSPRAYRGMLDILAREHRVVAPLLPALTWNRSRTPIKSHRDWADLVARFCAQMGIEAAHVVGQSTGGGVAACLAAAHPGLTRSLTLIDASGRRSMWPST
jgi:pimeloyl-ACP methyl ester carboxylesterase